MKDDLARAIIEYVGDSVNALPVSIPAVVEAYYPAKQTADIRLLLSRKMRSGTYDDPTKFVLPDIPVQQFAAADDCYLYLPIEKGTTGVLLTMDCDLWAWVLGNSDATRRTSSDRTHDLSDSVFLPGVRRNSAAVKPTDTANAELKNGSMRITLHPDGKIEIAGSTKEVVAIISSALGHISSFYTNLQGQTLIVAGSADPVSHVVTGTATFAPASFAADQTSINSDKADIDTMKTP